MKKRILLCVLVLMVTLVSFSKETIITDSYGREVKISKKPERIISLGPAITEIIYAVGAADLLVGRTEYCNFPSEVKEVDSIGKITNPSIEKILELNPDIVISSTHVNEKLVKKIEKLGIKIISLYNDKGFKATFSNILTIGNITENEMEAQRVVYDMKHKLLTVKNLVKDLEKPTVYYVVGFGKYGDYTAGSDTYINDLLELAGGKNAASDIIGWKYSLEKLLEKDPEILICSKYYGAKSGLEITNGYKNLSAVKSGELYEIDNNKLDRQGPRLADGVLDLLEIIHPELF